MCGPGKRSGCSVLLSVFRNISHWEGTVMWRWGCSNVACVSWSTLRLTINFIWEGLGVKKSVENTIYAIWSTKKCRNWSLTPPPLTQASFSPPNPWLRTEDWLTEDEDLSLCNVRLQPGWPWPGLSGFLEHLIEGSQHPDQIQLRSELLEILTEWVFALMLNWRWVKY